MIRRLLAPRLPRVSLMLCSIILNQLPVLTSAAIVTLDSIEIFTTHEWLPSKPRVRFQCKGEKSTELPDVKEKHVIYTFRGQESWQPLTDLPDTKCKRCGFYEKDAISDDTFDEWEFCASDFTRSDGKYVHIKDKELNATFLCPDCGPLVGASGNSKPEKRSNGMHWVLILGISLVVSSVLVIGLVSALKYWQKRKKEQEHVRFLKLFEETDDIEDELGIGPLSHVV